MDTLKQKLKLFQELSKSGIVALVLISVLGGYFIGHSFEKEMNWTHLFATLIAILCMASGSSALNQWQEIHIDRQMPRTAKRPIPSGRITANQALLFSVVNILIGLVMLGFLSMSLLWMGTCAVISYNFLYTLIFKRKMAFAAIPGAIPGALPIWMGHVASNGNVWTPEGLYLFFILFYWQMPHFWSLALKYKNDYEAGGIPTLPVARGHHQTIRHTLLWCFGYIALALAAPLFIPVGSVYLAVCILMSFFVLKELYSFAKASQEEQVAKQWLKFFLWINFSLIAYVFGIAIDQWSIHTIAWIKG